MNALSLFMRGLLEGALAAAACVAVLTISFAAVFLVLLCATPLKRLKP